jgi:hypothetical protein
VLGGGLCGAQATFGQFFDHLKAARERQSGMLMGVHPVSGFEWIGCLATSSLSNPIRMNTGYNLLKHHT